MARNILIDETPDLVIQVADAKNLKRSLVLTSLLADIGLPLVLVLNMIDEAAQKGIKVKRHKLEDRLGTAVLETVASEGMGIPALLSALDKAAPPSYPSRMPSGLADAVRRLAMLMADNVHPEWGKRALALFSLSADKETSRWAQQRSGISDHKEALDLIEDAGRPFHRTIDLAILRANDFWAEAVYTESIYFTPVTSTPILNRLGDLALTPVTGLLILFALLAALYFIVGKFAAGFLVDFLVKDIFGGLVGVHLKNVVAAIPFAWVRELIVRRVRTVPHGPGSGLRSGAAGHRRFFLYFRVY